MKTHNSQSRNPCCIKFAPTDAVCIRVEWLTDQSMVRALSHSKHEILPGSWMQNVNCTHFHFAVLVCHFLHLSDLPYTIYSEGAATYLSQCSWTGAAVCWQIHQRFTTAQAAVIHLPELTVAPRVRVLWVPLLTNWHTPTHAGTPTHTETC